MASLWKARRARRRRVHHVYDPPADAEVGLRGRADREGHQHGGILPDVVERDALRRRCRRCTSWSRRSPRPRRPRAGARCAWRRSACGRRRSGSPVRPWVGVSKNMTPPCPPTYHWKLPFPGAWAASGAVPRASTSAAPGMLRMSVRITDYLRKVSAPGGSWRVPQPHSARSVKMRDVAGNRGMGGGAVTRLTACCDAAYRSR